MNVAHEQNGQSGIPVGQAKELATRAIQKIAETWQVDKARSQWSERQFNWWPGDFRVCVRAQIPSDQDYLTCDDSHQPAHACRLITITDLLKDFSPDGKRLAQCALFARNLTSTYAWVHPPGLDNEGFWLSSSAYIDGENIGWMPEFFAKTSIIQAINAQIHAPRVAELLGSGVPDHSRPAALRDAGLDEMLEVIAQVYVPLGQQQSRWTGTDEFEKFAEEWGRSDLCFGNGDTTGLTLETPFGNDTALVRLHTEGKHPQLGYGLLGTLQVPYFAELEMIARECADLNALESGSWTGFPQLGCWHWQESRGTQGGLAFTSFIPNALYQPGIATNLAIWLVARSRWLRQIKWPDAVDQPSSPLSRRGTARSK
ncbi:MAG TPA: hypothetical protein VH678_27500 [Xanthobacteraceae bacterium]|jgi:hypothetical protein